jgi:hypothetical protein
MTFCKHPQLLKYTGDNGDMTGEHAKVGRVKAILQSHAQELRSAGFHRRLRSCEALSLFDLAGLQLRLSGILDVPVDLSGRHFLKDGESVCDATPQYASQRGGLRFCSLELSSVCGRK